MKIEQFEDKYLSHYSYAILSECKNQIILIDPSRDPSVYYNFAARHGAEITGIIETHPHADFVSSHLEIHNSTGAVIYCSKLNQPLYPFTSLDENEVILLGNIKLKAVNTPGHSPDSISILLEHEGRVKALFSGDTLFIGDCGRPDLRESGGDLNAERNFLARQMYHSLRSKLMKLADDVVLYPAHGAGTLCGKALSEAKSSTIGSEKISNWSLQEMSEEEFVLELNSNQPFIPAYFEFDVELNKKGAMDFDISVSAVPITENTAELISGYAVVDVRKEDDFKKGHLPDAINIMDGNKFETWLGSIIKPNEPFYLAAENRPALQRMIARAAAIGYETQIEQALVMDHGPVTESVIDIDMFRKHPDAYTIIDVRNYSEINDHPVFNKSLSIPLGELRNRLEEIPSAKPIAVHCAGGYRSAAGSSIISAHLIGIQKVYDIGEAIRDFDN